MNIVNKKRFFMFLIIIVLILIFIIFIFSNNRNKKFNEDKVIPPEAEEYNDRVKYKLQNIDNVTEYYTLKTIISKFYINYSRIFGGDKDDSLINDNTDYNKVVYSFLSKEYIEKNNISENNLTEIFPEIRNKDIELEQVYYIYDLERIKVYYVKGNLIDTENHSAKEFYMTVTTDIENFTFEVSLDYIDFNTLELNKETGFNFDINIENKGYNIFENYKVSYDEYAKDLFNKVRYMLLYDRNKAFELLNKNSDNMFNSFEELNLYVENNYQHVYLMTYSGYTTKINDKDSVDYICYDENSEYRITFYMNSIIDFTYSIQKIR